MRLFGKIILVLAFLMPFAVSAQNSAVVDYNAPKTYILKGLKVEGTNYLNSDRLAALTGLKEGAEIEIPGQELTGIMNRMWLQRKFSDVGFYIDSLSPKGDSCILVLKVQERPRVSKWLFTGVKRTEESDLMERLKLKRGGELSEYVERSSIDIIKNYYKEKGFYLVDVYLTHEPDTTIKNAAKATFHVTKGDKIKIEKINFNGIEEGVKELKLVKSMKKTRDRRLFNFFKSKKFIEKEYKNDKESLMAVFSEAGFRDAKIVSDSISYTPEGKMVLDINISQGKKYYFRDITWTGNSVYTAEQLNSVLMIGKGDVYDLVTMDKRLQGDPKQQHMDVRKMYTDNGYLFFQVNPVEMAIDGDSVDVQMRIHEGKPATFNNVIINGNTITSERVARRAVYTRPGYLYSQSDFERSIRELGSIGHFDPERFQSAEGYSVLPNINNNTVDIAYNVAEKPNSQLELSGGWGGNTFVGTLGVSFNNFSMRRAFEKGAWRPVPLGDGQTLAIRFQTNGRYYTALTASFVEPWLTGKKPTSLSTSIYYTRQTNSYFYYLNDDEYMEVYGIAASLGSRLKWPDDYFVLYHELSWQQYKLKDWDYNFLFANGKSNNLSYKITLTRNSTDQPIYPRGGSDFTFGVQLTPPYSAFRAKDTDYKNMADAEKYKWIEYHKWTFKSATYTKLIGDLVLKTSADFGYLGYYNKDLGYSPFEGFQLGGDGMSGYNTYGSDIIGLRGYPNYSLTPVQGNAYAGRVYDKFSVELRHPIILQPQSTIYGMLFLEGGNCWADIKDFNPFQIKRSAGVGLRVLLPIVGMMGIDWAYGFDSMNSGSEKGKGGSQFHFMIGQQF